MKRLSVWVSIGVVLGIKSVTAQPAPVQTSPPKVHRSACALAESMASKFPSKRMKADEVQRTCEALAPSMRPEDRVEFMRCCTAKLLQP